MNNKINKLLFQPKTINKIMLLIYSYLLSRYLLNWRLLYLHLLSKISDNLDPHLLRKIFDNLPPLLSPISDILASIKK